MSNIRSKNSIYVDSLVGFALDTKPYHSKVTEVAVEYRFEDTLNVNVEDVVASKMLSKAGWLYNYFSGGNSSFRSLPLQRVVNPFAIRTQLNSDQANNPGAFKVGRDESTDLLGVPFVYYKKATPGYAEVWKQGTRRDNLLRGHDYFHVYGSAEIAVSLPPANETDQSRRWQHTNEGGVISAVTAETQRLAVDINNPNSCVRRIREILLLINEQLQTSPSAAAQIELNAIRGITGVDTSVASISRTANTVTVTWDADPYALQQAYTVGKQVIVSADETSFDGTFTIQTASIADGKFRITYSHAGASGSAVAPAIRLSQPTLPRSYEALLNSLVATGTPVISGYTGWIGEDGFAANGTTTQSSAKYVDDALSRLTPPAFFSVFSDGRLREGSILSYPEKVTGNGFEVTSIVAQSQTPEEWSLQTVNISPLQLLVSGSVSGIIGLASVGTQFTSSNISFFVGESEGTPIEGDKVLFCPENKFFVSSTSPTQVWNLIKTDPLAYSRPTFSSSRFGSIEDLGANKSTVSILDQTIPTGTIVLTAINSNTFSLTSTAEPTYTATVTVGTTFNDGRLGFKIVAGSAQQFVSGDTFYISIVNQPALAVELDLYYGYDLDSYDNMTLLYNNTDPTASTYNKPVEFRYDSRFIDYDFSSLNLNIAQSARQGRKFKLTAIPDGQPVAILQKDGSGPSNAIDLAASDGGSSAPVISMPGDANSAADLLIYYASSFRLEFSDDDFNTKTFVANVPVDGTFTNDELGISFVLASGSKPFIAVTSDSGLGNPRAEGGDIFLFKVTNEPPSVESLPLVFSSPNAPYLLMHGSGFWKCPDANWTVRFTSSTAYEVTAIYSTGEQIGQIVPGYPKTGNIGVTGSQSFQNATYKDELVYFTIKSGSRAFAANDTFTFSTFSRKPSILVHGSVSGWKDEAVIGEWYWNGEIAFKVNLPSASTFLNINEQVTEATIPGISDISIRPDCSSTVYKFTKISTGSFVCSRSDTGIVGSALSSGTFSDEFISLTLNDPTIEVGESFIVQVKADELVFWNGINSTLIRPSIDSLVPADGDFISIQKAEESSVGISINYRQVANPPSLDALYPVGVDSDFIDTYTGPLNPSIGKFSPEATIFDGWLPLRVEGRDAINSIAFFPDDATSYGIYSAVTNEPIATIYSSATINEPIQLEWDETFFNSFLPLNSEANIITYGTQLDEKVKVSISEKINFLVSGGVLFEDALFSDKLQIALSEQTNLNITTSLSDEFSTNVEDGPFSRFMAGYANLPYDLEIGTIGPGCFDENFDTGISQYTLFSGNVGLFSVAETTYGQTLTVESQTSATPAQIRKNLPTGIQVDEFKFKVRLNNLNQDDAASIFLTDAIGNGLAGIFPAREAAFDFARRPLIFWRNSPTSAFTSTYLPSALALGVWYEGKFFNDSGTRKFSLTNLTNGNVQTISFGSSAAPVANMLIFTADSGSATCSTSYADITVCPPVTISGQYDTGIPLVDNFLRAKFLSELSALTIEQGEELAVLQALINPLLQPGGLSSTSLPDFLTNLDTDLFIDGSTDPELGIPELGMAVDVNQNSGEVASTVFEDSVSFSFTIPEGAAADMSDTSFGSAPFDTVQFDATVESEATFFSASPPPVPSSVPAGANYQTLQTPFFAASPARVFTINFLQPVNFIPTVQIATENQPELRIVPVVERLSARSFTFSIAASDRAKVVVT